MRFLCADVSIALGDTDVHMGETYTDVSNLFMWSVLLPPSSVGDNEALMRRCEYCIGNTDVHMGET